MNVDVRGTFCVPLDGVQLVRWWNVGSKTFEQHDARRLCVATFWDARMNFAFAYGIRSGFRPLVMDESTC